MPVLVLTNEQVRTLVPISAYVDAIETAYREFGLGRAVIQTRTDLYGESPAENQYCVFKSMVGLLAKDHIVALRINSDVISWTRREGNLRKEKIPAAEGGRWVGLVFIFDTLSGELRAIMPDGEVQRRRVGATTAVAVRHLARAGRADRRRLWQRLAGGGGGPRDRFDASRLRDAAVESEPGAPARPRPALPRRRDQYRGDGIARSSGARRRCRGNRHQRARPRRSSGLDRPRHARRLRQGTGAGRRNPRRRRPDRHSHASDLDPINYVAGKGSEPFRDTDFVDMLFGETRGDGDVREHLKTIAARAPDLADVVTGRVQARVKPAKAWSF